MLHFLKSFVSKSDPEEGKMSSAEPHRRDSTTSPRQPECPLSEETLDRAPFDCPSDPTNEALRLNIKLYHRPNGTLLRYSFRDEVRFLDVVDRPSYLPIEACAPVAGKEKGREYARDFAEKFVMWMQRKGLASRRWQGAVLWDVSSRWFASECGMLVPFERNFFGALKKIPGVEAKAHVRFRYKDGTAVKRTVYTLPSSKPNNK